LDLQFSLTNSALYASARGTYKDSNPLANVTILGVTSQVNNVTLNGAALSSGWTYNSTTQVLDIKGLSNSTSSGAWAQNWVLKWS
jgi:alpha-glucosidase